MFVFGVRLELVGPNVGGGSFGIVDNFDGLSSYAVGCAD